MIMANPHRGEATLTLNGQVQTLRLSLGALVQLEQALGSDSLTDLVARFENGSFRTRDILAVLFAALRAGGWTGTAQDLADADIQGGPIAAAQTAARVLALSFGADQA